MSIINFTVIGNKCIDLIDTSDSDIKNWLKDNINYYVLTNNGTRKIPLDFLIAFRNCVGIIEYVESGLVAVWHYLKSADIMRT